MAKVELIPGRLLEHYVHNSGWTAAGKANETKHSDSALSVSSDVLDSETIVLGFEDVLIVEMD